MKQLGQILPVWHAVLLAAWFGLAPLPAVAEFISPFLSVRATSSEDLSAFTKWTEVIPRYNAQHAQRQVCDAEPCPSEQWEALLLSLKGAPLKKQLSAINTFFNQFPYISDQDNYGVDDYWATPYELMSRGGDCEDYAIAKYISLRRLGVSESALRIVIVQDMNLRGTLHAVLEVNAGGVPYLLDNQAHEVIAAAKVFHYRPIYAINAEKWWAFK